jgi:hypothetical protein
VRERDNYKKAKTKKKLKEEEGSKQYRFKGVVDATWKCALRLT